MAVDEALLERYAGAAEADGPTLRLYSFSPPTLSLGRRQDVSRLHDPDFLRSQGIDLVRRPTGGGAVLHGQERTYAVTGRIRQEPFPGTVVDTYRRIAAALLEALRRLGVDAQTAAGRASSGVGVAPAPAPAPALCFEQTSVHEITVGGRKLVGSAQLRRRGAFLQHGSILLGTDPERDARAMGAPVGGGDRYTSLGAVLGRPVHAQELDDAIVSAFEAVFGAEIRAGSLDPVETGWASELRRTKYERAAWNLEGRA